MYPIRALRKLLVSSKSSYVKSDLRTTLDTSFMSVSEWQQLITIIDKKITSVKNYEEIDNLITDKDLLIKSKKMIAENLYRFANQREKNTRIMREIITASYEEAKRKSPSGQYPFSINNVALLCERVLVRTSQRSGQSKFNFYKLFYDQVLKKRAVVYSVTERKEVGGEEKLIHTFRSTTNFKQYEKWISLRTKNYPNNMTDALGMQV